MTQTVGLQGSIWSNNLKSFFLLASFPIVLMAMFWSFMFAFNLVNVNDKISWEQSVDKTNIWAVEYFGYVFLGVGIWFMLAWFSHQSIINMDTKARPLERRENLRVYNLLENLCISRGLKIPKLFIIDSEVLNAYASGINEKTYAITLTQGIINKLEDEELEAVIAHELSHIMNRDVRLLIISIIFVGIISMISETIVRCVTRGMIGQMDERMEIGEMVGYSNEGRRKVGRYITSILIIISAASIGYLLSLLIRFTLSRKREYLADAGAVELTRNSKALISALQKISGNSNLQVDDDVKQMMIVNDVSFLGMFSTHPPIEDRIAVLRLF